MQSHNSEMRRVPMYFLKLKAPAKVEHWTVNKNDGWKYEKEQRKAFVLANEQQELLFFHL